MPHEFATSGDCFSSVDALFCLLPLMPKPGRASIELNVGIVKTVETGSISTALSHTY
jgi:hypothetical protein